MRDKWWRNTSYERPWGNPVHIIVEMQDLFLRNIDPWTRCKTLKVRRKKLENEWRKLWAKGKLLFVSQIMKRSAVDSNVIQRNVGKLQERSLLQLQEPILGNIRNMKITSIINMRKLGQERIKLPEFKIWEIEVLQQLLSKDRKSCGNGRGRTESFQVSQTSLGC